MTTAKLNEESLQVLVEYFMFLAEIESSLDTEKT